MVKVNRNKLSPHETQYIFEVLNLRGSQQEARVNFRLFCVIAALSEAVVALHPSTRRCIAQLDLGPLNRKLQQAKNLFYCFDSDQTVIVKEEIELTIS